MPLRHRKPTTRCKGVTVLGRGEWVSFDATAGYYRRIVFYLVIYHVKTQP